MGKVLIGIGKFELKLEDGGWAVEDWLWCDEGCIAHDVHEFGRGCGWCVCGCRGIGCRWGREDEPWYGHMIWDLKRRTQGRLGKR